MNILSTRSSNGKPTDSSRLPKAPNVPQPVSQGPSVERIYSEEVLSFLQQNADNKRRIVETEAERDEWRRKMLNEKAERERLEGLLQHEAAVHEQAIIKQRADYDVK